MKKKVFHLLSATIIAVSLLLLVPQTAFAGETSGQCGPNLTWEYDYITETLYIRGSGEMDNWVVMDSSTMHPQPWGSYIGEIEKVVLPDGLTSIGDHAFSECAKLTQITIPANVKRIGEFAFVNCPIERLNLPAGLNEIGKGAFMVCQSLRVVRFGGNVKTVAKSAFESDPSIVNVTVPSLEAWCKINFQASNANPLYLGNAKLFIQRISTSPVQDVVIPEGITSVGSYVFYNYQFLRSVACPSTVQTIGNGAFSKCSNLSSIVLPDALTSVGGSAFSDCTSLTEIDFPDNVTKMGTSVFENCAALNHVTLGKSVDGIGDSAFRNCESLTEIVIPDTAKFIGNSAFYSCRNLASITIGSSVNSCGIKSFYDCRNLKQVNIRDIAAWCSASILNTEDSTPFAYDAVISVDGKPVNDLVIPDGVTNIGQYTFYGVTGLSSVTIPEGATGIGQHAFDGSTGLRTVILPSSLKGIDNFAFFATGVKNLYVPSVEAWLNVQLGNSYSNPLYEHYCTLYLDGKPAEKLIVPEGTTRIDAHRFDGMDNIKSVVLPRSIQKIDAFAFDYCRNIKDIYYAGTAEEWATVAVEKHNASFLTATVHMESTSAEYSSASVFSEGSIMIIIGCITFLVGAAFGLLIGKKVYGTKKQKAEPLPADRAGKAPTE